MEKYYDIYFHPADLRVDDNGDLMNPEAIHILCFDADGNVIGRVDDEGNFIDEPETPEYIQSLQHCGYGDDDLDEALKWFYSWLAENLEWRQTAPQTYYEPAEYKCIGISSYCGYADEEEDDDKMENYRLHWHL